MNIDHDIQVVTIRGLTEARGFSAEDAAIRAAANAAACLAEYQVQFNNFNVLISGAMPQRDLIIHIRAMNAIYAQVKAGTLS